MAIPPVEVQRFGQSIWTDYISRRLITGGELQRLIAECGVLGLTSNPSIFQQAIGDTTDYDDQIAAHLDEDAYTRYERLVIRDIQEAAAILLPVYERTGGVDGYVSLEVSPL
ncbi:MAG: transaldolase family protein, partial [Chloroflexota bacterium]